MMRKIWDGVVFTGVVMSLAAASFAQTAPASAPAMLEKDKPIEISSDKLDVFQNDHKAIFTGNVIAVQGTSTMRSAQMTVFYRDTESKPATPGAAAPATPPAPAPQPGAKPAAPAQGIYRIDAETNVVFTTPTETAIGDKGVYNVDANTIDLTGKIVTLTRGQNILKGTHAVYNMTTGRSVLTSSNGGVVDVNGGSAKPARVHGLFVPKSADSKPAGKP